ncbi:MAG: DUF1579 domain-containing protein [Gemmatimonadaceae bacterium]
MVVSRWAMLTAVFVLTAGDASAQAPENTAQLIAAQKVAMAPLSMMDGVWRGPASTVLQSGAKAEIVQTERVGPFLDGSVKVLEGRGYNADGSVGFNALGIISFEPSTKAYTMHSYAEGHSGDFRLQLTPDGFAWEIHAGPTTLRYSAVIANGTWHEFGDRIMPGRSPVRIFDMKLERVGDTTWPSAGAIPIK